MSTDDSARPAGVAVAAGNGEEAILAKAGYKPELRRTLRFFSPRAKREGGAIGAELLLAPSEIPAASPLPGKLAIGYFCARQISSPLPDCCGDSD